MAYQERSSESEMHVTANRSVLSVPALLGALVLSTPAAAQSPGAPPPTPPSAHAPSPYAPPSPTPPPPYAPPPGHAPPAGGYAPPPSHGPPAGGYAPPPGYAPYAPPPGHAPYAPPPGHAPYAPPPGHAPYAPPPGHAPPPGYALPPGYAPPAGGYAPSPGLGGAPPAQPILVTGLPRTLPFQEDAPPRRGYRLETRPRRGLIIAGASLLGGAWAVSALTAGTVLSEGGEDGGRYWPLLLPVAGPFITIGTANAEGDDESPVISLVLLSGLTQTAGLAMIVGGLLSDQKIWVRNDIPVKTSLRSPEVLLGPAGGAVRIAF